MSEVTFYYATMGAGKSLYLLQMNYMLKKAGFKPWLLKPEVDTRPAGKFTIESRIGLSEEADSLIKPNGDLEYREHLVDWSKNDVRSYGKRKLMTHVLVDEAHFLNRKNVEWLCSLADEKYNPLQVIAFGLRTSYTGHLFEGTAAWMALADNIIELPMTYEDGSKAICHVRTINGKPVFEGNPVVVGGDDVYQSVSRKHWFELKDKYDYERRTA